MNTARQANREVFHEMHIYNVADKFIRRNKIDTFGYYRAEICYRAVNRITLHLEFANLKDAIRCLRYVKASLNGDFVEATIKAFHFRINSGSSIGYRLTADGETSNDAEVNTALAELNAGDNNYHENQRWIFWDRMQDFDERYHRR